MSYLKGKILTTAAMNFKRDLLDSGGAKWKKLVMSSYCTDPEWLVDQLRAVDEACKVVLIGEGYGDLPAGIRKASLLGRNITMLTPMKPKFPDYGVFHCKFMVMFGEDLLRLVISSGNLVPYDYGNVVDNILFVQDFPKLKGSMPASMADYLLKSQFYRSFCRLLEIIGCFRHPDLVLDEREMEAYDWRELDERLKLVYSAPGYFRMGERDFINGLLMMNSVAGDLIEGSNEEHTIEYQGSSLGNLTTAWLDEFGQAAIGKLNPTTDKKRKLDNDARFDFKIVFPTLQTVLDSSIGPESFGTLFCKQKDYLSPAFPRHFFYDCHSEASGPTNKSMHSKIMTVSSGVFDACKSAKGSSKDDPIELDSSDDENKEPVCYSQTDHYRYIGSHNFTASAWGRLCKGGSALLINNYEVGLLIPSDFSSKSIDSSNDSSKSVDFSNSSNSSANFPYTYHRPPCKYMDTDLPWDQMTYFSE